MTNEVLKINTFNKWLNKNKKQITKINLQNKFFTKIFRAKYNQLNTYLISMIYALIANS